MKLHKKILSHVESVFQQKPLQGKAGAGAVIVIYGTSTAGKTTLCKNLVELSGKKRKGEPSARVFSMDDYYFRAEQDNDANLERILMSSEASASLYTSLQPKLGKYALYIICDAIRHNRLKIGKLNLNFATSDANSIQTFWHQLPKSSQTKYTVEVIHNIMRLTSFHAETISCIPERPDPLPVVKALVEDAVLFSKQGGHSYIDIFPIGENIIPKLRSMYKSFANGGSFYLFVLHTSVFFLIERMRARNKMAMEQGNEREMREDLNPFYQYARMYVSMPNERVSDNHDRLPPKVGTVCESDLRMAVSAFGHEADYKSLANMFGMADLNMTSHSASESEPGAAPSLPRDFYFPLKNDGVFENAEPPKGFATALSSIAIQIFNILNPVR